MIFTDIYIFKYLHLFRINITENKYSTDTEQELNSNFLCTPLNLHYLFEIP